jgi:phage terminase large subunit
LSSITLPNNWEPRRHQFAALNAFDRGIKRHVWVWHRRFGKDDVALNLAAREAWTNVGEYWHMLPQAEQSRKAIWEAVNPHTGVRRIDQAFPMDVRENYRESDMMIRLKTGSIWRVVGSDNYNSLVGTPPRGIVFSEYALADPAAWDLLRPILLENRGWAIFISTPRGDNHLKQIYDYAVSVGEAGGWFAQKLSCDDTGLFSQDQLDTELAEMQARHGPEDGRALFDQEYRCSFVAPLIGSYYARLIENLEKSGRITSVEPVHNLPVNTAWDLGVGDSTAIWCFQSTPLGIRVVDYFEAQGQGMEYYVEWLDKRGYRGADLLPHDARQRIPVGNPPRTRIELMIEMGRKPQVVPLHRIDDGISAARMTLPLCSFDAVKCQAGLRTLRNYRRQWNDQRNVFVDAPLHDWASHGADAFRTLAMGWNTIKAPEQKAKKEIETRMPTLEEIFTDTGTDRRI